MCLKMKRLEREDIKETISFIIKNTPISKNSSDIVTKQYLWKKELEDTFSSYLYYILKVDDDIVGFYGGRINLNYSFLPIYFIVNKELKDEYKIEFYKFIENQLIKNKVKIINFYVNKKEDKEFFFKLGYDVVGSYYNLEKKLDK